MTFRSQEKAGITGYQMIPAFNCDLDRGVRIQIQHLFHFICDGTVNKLQNSRVNLDFYTVIYRGGFV